jgi:hypothetical protein
MSYTVRLFDASTCDVFAELVERNNGIFGGCWCIGYHSRPGEKGTDYRAAKEARVRTGRPTLRSSSTRSAPPRGGASTAASGAPEHQAQTRQTILIHCAAGGARSIAVQLAHELGARVIGTRARRI